MLFATLVLATISVGPSDPSQASAQCQDEAARPFGMGALRRVAGQIQRCDETGIWVVSPPTPSAGKLPCSDEQGQKYGPSALRETSGQVQQCDDTARWIVWSVAKNAPEQQPQPAAACTDQQKQRYGVGAVHQTGKTLQRCAANGKCIAR